MNKIEFEKRRLYDKHNDKVICYVCGEVVLCR